MPWQSFYHDAMVEHDKHVGEILDLLDELDIAGSGRMNAASAPITIFSGQGDHIVKA